MPKMIVKIVDSCTFCQFNKSEDTGLDTNEIALYCEHPKFPWTKKNDGLLYWHSWGDIRNITIEFRGKKGMKFHKDCPLENMSPRYIKEWKEKLNG